VSYFEGFFGFGYGVRRRRALAPWTGVEEPAVRLTEQPFLGACCDQVGSCREGLAASVRPNGAPPTRTQHVSYSTSNTLNTNLDGMSIKLINHAVQVVYMYATQGIAVCIGMYVSVTPTSPFIKECRNAMSTGGKHTGGCLNSLWPHSGKGFHPTHPRTAPS
jgi:hypothetical protein